jgi:hypothetical protein
MHRSVSPKFLLAAKYPQLDFVLGNWEQNEHNVLSIARLVNLNLPHPKKLEFP